MFQASPADRGYQSLAASYSRDVVGVNVDEGDDVEPEPETDDDLRVKHKLTCYSKAQKEHKARLAIARLLLSVKEVHELTLQTNSVYGTALVMPQIARSSGWPARLVVVCLRAYFLHAMNCFMQWFLVYSIMKEEQVMDFFAGQMWMCDFGARKEGCPEADGCLGPDGTRITPSRLYSFEQWAIQNFVQASLVAIFPEHSEDIGAKVDPGEYGVESQHCRWLSSMLFVVAVMQDFRDSVQMLRVLWCVPSADESWVSETGEGEVQLQIAGMPRIWKLINLFLICIPKLMLWQFTCRTGMVFLLETAGIDNVIINATALCFILEIDELFYATYSTPQTVCMMERLEGFDMDEEDTRLTSETEALNEEANEVELMEKSYMFWYCSGPMFPTMLFLVAIVWGYLHWVYYSTHCFVSEDGTYVSIPMHMPVSSQYSHLSAFLPQMFPIEVEKEAYWRYKN
jgi:hypothetical protein